MKINQTIGIDVSKNTLDVFIHVGQVHHCFANNAKGFLSMIAWVNRQTSVAKEKRLFVFENTGLYSVALAEFLSDSGSNFSVVSGLEIKKSLGIVRGKDDKSDSKAIALYAYRRRDELQPYKMPSKNLSRIRRLLLLREKLVRQRAGFKSTETEIKEHLHEGEHPMYFRVHHQMILHLSQQIRSVENEIRLILFSDKELFQLFTLITSIVGIGEQTALFMLAYTNGFTLFDNSRKFASYAGIAPFPYQSGTGIRGRTKVNHFANKRFKSLLSNCALSAIANNPEIRSYFERRINEGKNKMSTINIVRNKLLSRIFAVVRRGTPYIGEYAPTC